MKKIILFLFAVLTLRGSPQSGDIDTLYYLNDTTHFIPEYLIAGEVYNDFRFTLEQNYPNPFNPVTLIKYAIPLLGGDERGGLVTLKVYDVLGNEVATLVNEEKPVGTYEVVFNPASSVGYASGVYFYQLRANNYIETKKMILLK